MKLLVKNSNPFLDVMLDLVPHGFSAPGLIQDLEKPPRTEPRGRRSHINPCQQDVLPHPPGPGLGMAKTGIPSLRGDAGGTQDLSHVSTKPPDEAAPSMNIP